MDRVVYLILVAVAAFTYVAMVFWTMPAIVEATGGALSLDMHLGGYGMAEAEAFKEALTPDAVALLLGLQLYVDAVFPLLFALSLTPPINGILRGRPAALRIVGTLVPMLAAVHDYAENILLVRLVQLGMANLPLSLVEMASRATMLKARFNMVAIVLVIALFMATLFDQRRARA